MQVQLVSGNIVYIEEYGIKEITHILKLSWRVTAFYLEFNNQIPNEKNNRC